MKKRFLFLIILVVFSFISASSITEDLHLNIQTTNASGSVVTGTFAFGFNISTTSDCAHANIIYSNSTDLTTDSRGVISYYLPDVSLNYSEQYWLCYYRDNTLVNSSKIARTPYTFRAKNITLGGVEVDSNLNMGDYNITVGGGWLNNGVSIIDGSIYAQVGYFYNITSLNVTKQNLTVVEDLNVEGNISASTGFFTWLGTLSSRITQLFIQAIDFTGNINGSGNITTTGFIGIGTEYLQRKLSVNGDAVIEDNLISTQDNGIYFGRTRISENQWGLANVGYNWTSKAQDGNWYSVAMSSDGKYQTAVAYNDDDNNISISSDYGQTWTVKGQDGDWYSVAMSSDGKYQTAVESFGANQISISSDYGQTWTVKGQTGDWRGVAMSSDGKYQTAVSRYDSANDISISSDYGQTWSVTGQTGDWYGIAMSSDGKYQTAVSYGDSTNDISISSDYGQTWTSKAQDGNWYSVAMSSDGKYQTAVSNNDGDNNISISSDYGQTWTVTGQIGDWLGIAMSSDGEYQTAVAYTNADNNISISSDYGQTWTSKAQDGNWRGVAMSSDGKYQTLVSLNDVNNNISVSYADSITYGNVDIGGTMSVGDGSGSGVFNSIGDSAGMDDGLNANNDLYVGGELEVDGTMYLTGGYGSIVQSDIAENLLTEKGRNHVLCESDTSCIVEDYTRELEFGDIVCINPEVAQTIMLCVEANSKLAVGVISNTSVLQMGNNGKYGYPLAVAGIVWSKVSNENGNIVPGDLMVSASKPGYAMKNNNPKDGTVIGKSFDFCDKDDCRILMFVALS